MADDDVAKIAKEAAVGVQFVYDFAMGLQKLKAAADRDLGVALTTGEAKAVVQAFRFLRDDAKKRGN